MTECIADVIDAARKRGIDLSNKKRIRISLDVTGLQTATDSAALESYSEIRDAIRELDKLYMYIVINMRRDSIKGSCVPIFGEDNLPIN